MKKSLTVFIKSIFSLNFLLVISLVALFFSSTASQAIAACPSPYTCKGGCESVGQCVGGRRCIVVTSGTTSEIAPFGGSCGGGSGQAIFGRVMIPFSILRLNSEAGSLENIGVFAFANTLLLLFFSICVIWFMFNLIYTGYLYLASPSDAKVLEKFKEALFYPAVGMVVLAASFLIVSLIGSFVYGNPNFILQPSLPTATDFAPTAPAP